MRAGHAAGADEVVEVDLAVADELSQEFDALGDGPGEDSGPEGLVGPEGSLARKHHGGFLPVRDPSGEQKRVAMAGALAMRPSILILDEPTAGLDPAGEELILRLLRHLNRDRGLTIILATHSVDLLPLFADQICALNRGAVLCQGPVGDVFGDHEMLSRACLRLPYITSLLLEMKERDGVPINGLPLTVGDARKRLLELIPPELIVKQMEKGIR